MAGRECYHCKQWIEDGEEHNCWTTTEAALTQDLSDDLRDAWERLREKPFPSAINGFTPRPEHVLRKSGCGWRVDILLISQ
jgi:hypothetical protein